jgi:hypothetical protein
VRSLSRITPDAIFWLQELSGFEPGELSLPRGGVSGRRQGPVRTLPQAPQGRARSATTTGEASYILRFHEFEVDHQKRG